MAAAHLPEMPEMSPLTVQLAPMRRKHLRTVTRIENQVFPRPWTTSLFLSELAMRGKRAYTVAQVGSLVVGYTGLMFVDDDAHITTIAVDPLWQKHQIATRLMLQNIRFALGVNAKNMTLEVKVTNDSAQKLYQKFGFAPAGVRKNYYAEVDGDALIMWAHGIDTDEYALRMSAIEAAIIGATIAEVPK